MKRLLGGASALALILGLSAPGFAADVTVGGSSAFTADAVSVNIQDQNVDNSVDIDGGLTGTVGDDATVYDATMDFGATTFSAQDVDVNDFNSGINALQQGGISIAVASDPFLAFGGAVAGNVLSQASSNSISVSALLADGLDDGATFIARMEFADDTFNNQDIVVNNFNTGWNAAQQGGIAIAAGTGVLDTTQP